MPRISVNDIELYYEQRGKGAPLLLIMGWEANIDWWSEVLLERLAQHFRVIAFDNRGAGRSESPGGRYDIPLLAHDAVGLLDALDVPLAHVFGISMGGMIAQQLALDHPERVGKLVLGCTTARPWQSFWPTSRRWQAVRACLGQRDKGWRGVQYYLRFSEWPDESELTEHLEALQRAPIAGLDSLRQFMGVLRFNSVHRLSEVQVPTLIMAGTADLMVPPDSARELAEAIPEAVIVMFEGRGHLFFNQEPERVARLITTFVETPEAVQHDLA